MRKTILLAIAVLTFGCQSAGKRSIASLDNNSATTLDKLETAWAPDEEEQFQKVAEEVQNFVVNQANLRQAHFGDFQKTGKHADIYRDLPAGRYATRDVHRKTHGCYAANLKVSPTVLEDLNLKIAGEAQPLENADKLGIFRPGSKYDAIVRYSNGHPGRNPDSAPDARGMAVKILPNSYLRKDIASVGSDDLNRSTLLDVVTINFPTFFVNSPENYLKINEWFLSGALDFTGKLEAGSKGAIAIFFAGMNHLERKLALLTNGSIIYSPLYQRYFSMVPSRLGPKGDIRAVKYAWYPAACAGDESFAGEAKVQWAEWTRRRDFAMPHLPLAKKQAPPHRQKWSQDYLRTNTKKRLLKAPFCFALMMQLYRDQNSTSIEDSTDIWLHDQKDRNLWLSMLKTGVNVGEDYEAKVKSKQYSPYVQVATLTIEQIPADYPAQNTGTCENLSFNPWNGRIDYHQPLGVVSRMKRRVYNASRRMRHQLNGLPTSNWERR